jgi:hypothetical protein
MVQEPGVKEIRGRSHMLAKIVQDVTWFGSSYISTGRVYGQIGDVKFTLAIHTAVK